MFLTARNKRFCASSKKVYDLLRLENLSLAWRLILVEVKHKKLE